MLNTLTHVDERVLAEIAEEKQIRGTKEVFILFDLGSQFSQLIFMMLDKLGLFCLVADPCRIKAADIGRIAPIGIILSGGPVSVYENPPPFDDDIFDIGIPVFYSVLLP